MFAILSEIPFDLAIFNGPSSRRTIVPFDFYMQNVMFTFAIALLVLIICQKIEYLHKAVTRILLQSIVVFIGICAAEFFKTDGGGFGILFIVISFLLRRKGFFLLFAQIGTAFVFSKLSWQYVVSFFCLSMLYNGEKGKRNIKYLFYSFYPLHFIILFLLTRILNNIFIL